MLRGLVGAESRSEVNTLVRGAAASQQWVPEKEVGCFVGVFPVDSLYITFPIFLGHPRLTHPKP